MSPDPGLYVHVPFCSALCPYCDFAVNVATAERRERYRDLLLKEIALRPDPSAAFDTLYFGGGTPSSLRPGSFARICEELAARGWLASDCRLFLEANPEDVTSESLAGLREAGVSTLSLGVQSLNADALRFLGRRHRPEDARRSFALAREAGFETVSLDLIYGLPGQSEKFWREDLQEVVALGPDHLSCYQLTIHEKTVFGRRAREGRLREATGDAQGRLFRLTHVLLKDFGYDGYEVSNFARAPRHRSRHNEKYWSHAPYLGLGPSAHSFEDRRRSWNLRSFFDWERHLLASESPTEGEEELTDEELLLESLMLRLRTREGLDLDAARARFGVDLLEVNRSLVEKSLEDSLLILDGPHLRPTLDGLAVADGLASAFRLPPEPWKAARL